MNINSNEVYLDWLTIRLNSEKINPRFFSAVAKSPIRPFSASWLDLHFYFDEFYWTHTIYYIADKRGNKLAQIMLTTALNKRSDYYDKISFYGVFFNLYINRDEFHWQYVFKNIFDFFGITANSSITRADIKTDVTFIPHFCDEYLVHSKLKRHWFTWFSYSDVSNKTSASYKFRIYDKRLDIVDNELYNVWTNFDDRPYLDMLSAPVLWRIELELNSRSIKEKKITLTDLFNQSFLYDQINNFSIRFLDEFSGSTKYIKRDSIVSDISHKRQEVKYAHTVIMADSYIEKLAWLDKPKLYSILKKHTDLFSDTSYNDIQTLRSGFYSIKEYNASLLEENKKLKKLLTNKNISYNDI